MKPPPPGQDSIREQFWSSAITCATDVPSQKFRVIDKVLWENTILSPAVTCQ